MFKRSFGFPADLNNSEMQSSIGQIPAAALADPTSAVKVTDIALHEGASIQPLTSEEKPQSVAVPHEQPSSAKPIVKKKHLTRSRAVAQTQCKEYIGRFKGNNSKLWDGKDIVLDADWVEEKYSKEELFPGRIVKLPWEGKDGQSVHWRMMIVSVPASNSELAASLSMHGVIARCSSLWLVAMSRREITLLLD